jgi:hypothetical protein
MSRVERDPERGRAAAVKLRALGAKRILIKAAEQGYITQVACKMPECFCPEELGGAGYFEPVSNKWSDWKSDWMPTVEHFPVYKKDGGKETVDNVILAHRLCNRLDHSLRVGRPHARDLERIRKAREEGIPPQQRTIVGRLRLAAESEHGPLHDAGIDLNPSSCRPPVVPHVRPARRTHTGRRIAPSEETGEPDVS